MSCPNPTGRGFAVPLRTPERHRGFLLETFSLGRAVIAESLARPKTLADLPRKQREADVYDRLIAAIREGSIIVPDPDVRRVVELLLEVNDHEADYGRVVAEHAALVGLLDQIGGWR
ncbi:MAG TPA: hypothetical protein VFK14_03630 [Solirubrobacterales bacterium]|nr:hypothetical protein [Solirubrobacterales bacterium]